MIRVGKPTEIETRLKMTEVGNSCCQHLWEVKWGPFAFGGLLLPWLSFANLNKHFRLPGWIKTYQFSSTTFSTKATLDLKRGARRSLMANVYLDEMRHFCHISEESHICSIKFQIHDALTLSICHARGSPQSTTLYKKLLTFFFEAALLTLLELEPAPGYSFQSKRYNVLGCPMNYANSECFSLTKMYWKRSPKERRTNRIAKHWLPLIRKKLVSFFHSDIQRRGQNILFLVNQINTKLSSVYTI